MVFYPYYIVTHFCREIPCKQIVGLLKTTPFLILDAYEGCSEHKETENLDRKKGRIGNGESWGWKECSGSKTEWKYHNKLLRFSSDGPPHIPLSASSAFFSVSTKTILFQGETKKQSVALHFYVVKEIISCKGTVSPEPSSSMEENYSYSTLIILVPSKYVGHFFFFLDYGKG